MSSRCTAYTGHHAGSIVLKDREAAGRRAGKAPVIDVVVDGVQDRGRLGVGDSDVEVRNVLGARAMQYNPTHDPFRPLEWGVTIGRRAVKPLNACASKKRSKLCLNLVVLLADKHA
jgi:hypothetical protein